MSKEFEGKKLLVLGAKGLAVEIINHAKAMGAYVIAADFYEDSIGKKIADRGVDIDATDVDAIVAFCRKEKVDGVTTGFFDVLLKPCYEVCKRLNLPYYATEKMINMATNKTVFKETCKKYDVPVPETLFIGSDLSDELIESIAFPVFVKPLDASGSRGAGVCYNVCEFKEQFSKAKSFSDTDIVLVEQYITGREFLLDYIAVDGEFRLLESFDRYTCSDRLSAVNYANFSIAPSLFLNQYYEEINDKVINMFKAEGFTDGLIFLQGHFDGNKITFYEMGCRLGGAFYNLEEEVLKFNSIDMVIRYALTGKMINDIDCIDKKIAIFKDFAVSYNFLLSGKDETVNKIIGLEDIRKIDSVAATIQNAFEGNNYYNDRIVDKPALTIHFVEKSIDDVKSTINYMNGIFDVLNKDGKSMLMEKFNPESIEL